MTGKPVCPECGASDPRKYGHTAFGKQRFQCKKCGRSFISPENYVPPARSGHVCPHCGGLNTIRYGRRLLTRGRERQIIKCKDCNKTFYQPKEEVEG